MIVFCTIMDENNWFADRECVGSNHGRGRGRGASIARRI